MKSTKRPRLQAVQAGPDYTLSLMFIDGRHLIVDMSGDMQILSGLAPLKDADAFSEVTLGDEGWTVEWPNLDIQIGADTLYFDALAWSS